MLALANAKVTFSGAKFQKNVSLVEPETLNK